MLNLKYTEILRLNKDLGNSVVGDVYQVKVLSNIITTQLNEIMEYALRIEGINTNVSSGDYDNIIQDSIKYNNADAIIIFWELANIIDGLQYKANLMDDEAINELVLKICSEIDFVLDSLKTTSLVIFNKFSSLIFNCENLRENNFDKICRILNNYLQEKSSANMLTIDIDKVLARISISKSTDFRYYYSSKALYTVEFYKYYAQFISPIIKSVKGKAKKALIFDCDNTLWKGILGEDGADKIEMSAQTKSGVVFEEVQNLAIDLARKGILIGFCSKNNFQDVETIINEHPDMSIRNNDIAIKKINWENKAENLTAIAQEINIGLDSLVFVDDSDFETGYIKNNIPDVTVLQVPENLYEYPQMMRDNIALFFNVSQSKEDNVKTEMYKQQAKRAEEKTSYTNIENYLTSLELEITIYANETELIPRVSQLTQKTNQFNLTTKRYTEANIEVFAKTNDNVVFAFNVKDKYGDSGVTGICMLEIDLKRKSANIDSLLISCRIIGRNIELTFFDFLIDYLKGVKIEILTSSYIKTFKNEQVSNFYEQLGFERVKNLNGDKDYSLQIDNYKNSNINYIKINYGRKN